MSVRMMIGTAMLAAFALVQPALAQEPTLHEVYEAAESGNLAQAQRMMSEVLRAHPNSAKAHYVEAELLAKQGQLAAAAAELGTAERLDPGLPFARPEAVRELKARIASPRSYGQPLNAALAPTTGGGISWGGLLLGVAGLAVIALGVAAMLNRRKAPAFAGAGVQPYNPNAPLAPTQPPATGSPVSAAPSGGMSSGILGGLATGAAVGAGIVAGEALAQRLMGGHHGEASASPLSGAQAPLHDMGGSDFGVSDASSWDDGIGGVGGDGGGDWS